jgi:hypothetical protein
MAPCKCSDHSWLLGARDDGSVVCVDCKRRVANLRDVRGEDRLQMRRENGPLGYSGLYRVFCGQDILDFRSKGAII